MNKAIGYSKLSTRCSYAAGCGVTALAIALSTAQPLKAQSCVAAGQGICKTVVTQNDQVIQTQSAIHVANQANGTSISQGSNDYLLVENQPGATIASISLIPASPTPPQVYRRAGTTIINAGAIEGDLVFANGGVYVDAGGSVAGEFSTRNGSVPFGSPDFISGFTTEIFVDRTAGGRLLDAGHGIDFLVQSYSEVGTSSPNIHPLASRLPAGYEVGGVEAFGNDVVVAIHNEMEGQSTSGVALMGNGGIVNRAIIDRASLVGSGFPPQAAVSAVFRAVTYAGEVGKGGEIIVPSYDDLGRPANVLLGYGGALTFFANEGEINGDLLVRAAEFDNSGEINLRSSDPGTLIYAAADMDFSFSNTGSVAMVDNGIRATASSSKAALAISSALDATSTNAVDLFNGSELGGGISFQGYASSFVFENIGTITVAGNPNSERAVDLTVGNIDLDIDRSGLPPEWLLSREFVAAESVAIDNSGVLEGGISAEAVTPRFSFLNGADGQILSDPNDAFAEAVELSVENYWTGEGSLEATDGALARFENRGKIVGKGEIEFEATDVEFINSGTIQQNKIAPSDLNAGRRAAIELDVESPLDARVTFENSGEIVTADHAGVGAAISVLASKGTEDGIAGAENATAIVNVVNSGTIRAAGGNYVTPGAFLGLSGDTIVIDFAAGLAVLADAQGGSSISIRNESGGLINARGEAHLGTPSGKQEVLNQEPTAGGIAVVASAENVSIVNAGTILGSAGAASFTSSGGTFIPADAPFDLEDPVYFADILGGAIDTFRGNDAVVNEAGGVIEGGIALRGGDDSLSNYGAITGNIYFGDGDDRFIQGIRASFDGVADGGAGSDTFLIDITGGGTINEAIYGQLVNFEVLGLTGSGSIETQGPLPFETVEISGNNPFDIPEGEVIETQGPVAVTGTDEDNVLTNRGTINGAVDLGGGDDALILDGNWAINGVASGGEGIDNLRITLAGTPAEPTEINLSQFEDFEQFAFNGGTGAVSGTATFDDMTINDGYLFGRVGSIINSNVDVSEGATFGSAGTVNGAIQVAGTLSPGSSPGTMTINGDVSLAETSVTVFEMTPTVSDAIVINGSLNIDRGATLNITGERPLTPGVTYNLITASGGIDGQFVINKVDTVLGFVSQNETALQLLGTFQVQAGATVQSSRTTDYLNSLLIGGTAPAGVLAAVPDLLDPNGFVDEAAVATISPEAYASAVQIGVENGLAITSALRSSGFVSGNTARPFTFGQAFGQWRNFAADKTSGTARANVRTSGVLGGIGFGEERASVSVFVGYVDARQELQGRGAVTNADGLFAGANLLARLGNFQVGGSVVWDRTSAETERSLFNDNELSDKYRLRTVTLDGFVGYGLAFSNGWEVGPQLGITHVAAKRGHVSEAGGGAFALQVARQRYDATFLSGDLALTRPGDALWQPYLSVGIRHQIGGDPIRATGGFIGVPATFAALGAERDDTFGRVQAGFAVRLSDALSLFARGESEFGAGNNARAVNGGLRFNF